MPILGTKITLYLRFRDPNRLRVAEISNWNGKGLAAPRTDLDELLQRPELKESGVYILSGTDPQTGRALVYVGETEDLGERLKAHRSKDFWVSIIVFVGTSNLLTKAHIKFLEGRILEEAKAIDRADLENSVSSGAKLPEADRDSMEDFLLNIKQLLPILGSDLLTPVTPLEKDAQVSEKLTTSIKGLTAQGRRTPNGFVVFAGSQAVTEIRAAAQTGNPFLVRTQKQFLEDGVLQIQGDNLVFTRDAEFSSPSAAATLIHGGNVNGLMMWKNSVGKTLKDLESA